MTMTTLRVRAGGSSVRRGAKQAACRDHRNEIRLLDRTVLGWVSTLILAAGLLLVAPAAGLGQDAPEQSDDKAIAEDLAQVRKDLLRLRAQLKKQLSALEKRLEALESRLGHLAAGNANSEAAPRETQVPGQTSDLSATPTHTKTANVADGPPTVCREGCDFSDLNKAIKAAKAGDTITVGPGLIGTCGVIDKPLTLVGLKDPSGKRAHLGGGTCWGKGPLVVRASDILIEGFEISNVTVRDKNGACIRIDPEAGDVTIRDLYCHDSENGILGGPKKGIVTIENSLFERNGANKGRSHGVYINRGDALVLRDTRIISGKGQGHTLKSGARRTVVEDSVLAALEGRNSRAIDAYGGGELVVRRSVIQQGKHSDNHEAFGIAVEPKRLHPEPHSTVLEDNWIIFDDLTRCCRWLFYAKQFGPFTVSRNTIVGMTHVSSGHLSVAESENRLFANREQADLPPYDGTLSSLPTPGATR